MPDSIRDRLRRILNGDPAQRMAQTDQIRRAIDVQPATPLIESAARSAPIDRPKPDQSSAAPSASAAKPIEAAAPRASIPEPIASIANSIEAAAPMKPAIEPVASTRPPTAPAVSSSTAVTQPSLPKVNVTAQSSNDRTVPMRPIDLPAADDPYQSPAVLRPIDHSMVGDVAEAQAFIENLREKMAALAEDFAAGHINRQQFESVYVHYREQRQMIEGLLTSMTSSAWRKAVAEGETAILLKRSTAKVLSYALYENDSSILLASSGDFKIDPAVVVPMLSAYRSATAEAFGAGIRNSEIEGGRWLTFIPGRQTTFIVLFSIQPARGQLDMLEDLHRDFETANAGIISEGKGQEAAEQFVRLWSLGRGA
jgi:hypothetical protein